ncbi:MAG: hypothetical protein WBC03_04545 [Albidovulum sp.]|nr:hypothetical protein [uncultured Defluviimonas sp.]
MRKKLALGNCLAFGCMPAIVGETDHISGKGEGNDLAPPVRLHARKPHHAPADLVDMLRAVAFVEERLAEAEPSRHRIRQRSAPSLARFDRLVEWLGALEDG